MLILGKFNQNQYSEKYTFCCQQCFGNRITETLKIGHEIQMHLHHQSASELQQFFLDVIHGPTKSSGRTRISSSFREKRSNRGRRAYFVSVGYGVDAFVITVKY